MRIALVGMGRMGEAVSEVAEARDCEIVARFDEYVDEYPRLPDTLHLPRSLKSADAIIDFTLPDAALENIERYCRWGIPAVIGTTGWYDRLDEAQALVDKHAGSILYAPNFSIGVALLVRAIRAILPLLDEWEIYDVVVQGIPSYRQGRQPFRHGAHAGQSDCGQARQEASH